MKFFEFYTPYYALIAARDLDVAVEFYPQVVADITPDGYTVSEVGEEYALEEFDSGIPEENCEREFYALCSTEGPHVLMIDGNL